MNDPQIKWTRRSSQDQPSHLQFDSWAANVSGAYDVTPGRPARQGYDTQYVGFECGPLFFDHYRRDPATAVRSADHIRRSSDDSIRFQFSLAGSWDYQTGVDEGVGAAGGLFIIDMTQPIKTRNHGSELISLVVPRTHLSPLSPQLGHLHGFYADTVLTALFKDHMRAMVRRASDITADVSPLLFEATTRLLIAALSQTRDALALARPEIDARLLSRAKTYIDRLLLWPELSPDAVARYIGVSRRKLYHLFEAEGGVARYVRTQRLRAAHDVLANTSTRRAVKAVAFEFGFASEAHFSRSFKNLFGYNARDAADAARKAATR